MIRNEELWQEKSNDVSTSIKAIKKLLTLSRIYFSPKFMGLEALSLERPALWVGNHTLYGMLDAPLLVNHLHERYGISIKSLGDQGHFKVPVWREILGQAGMVMGSRDNCRALMRNRNHILVFPGGAREVYRRKGEKHQLIWKRRTGFARMAIENSYDIIPFASLGPDHAYDILWDGNDMKSLILWQHLEKHTPINLWTRNGDTIPPISRGISLTPFPRPERFYFGFGQRIETYNLLGQENDPEVLWNLREKVANSIEDQIDMLELQRQKEQPYWSSLRRWFTKRQY